MNNLHLTVLNEGSVYGQLRHIARQCHSGVWSERRAWPEYRRIVRQIGERDARRFDEPEPTDKELDAATDEVAAYHARHMAEEPPTYAWVVTRGDDGRKVRFVSESEAFAYILKTQGQSVHHATKYEGWTLEPIA